MAENPAPYESRFGYQVTSEDRTTLGRFPRSGLYRAGEVEPLRTFRWPIERHRIIAFFTYDEGVRLVLKDPFGFRVFDESESTVVINGIEDDWVQAPWLYTGYPAWMGIEEGFDVQLLRDQPRPRLRIQVLEAAPHVYDAPDGTRLVRGESDTGAPVRPNRLEQGLVGTVEEFSAMAAAGRIKDAQLLFVNRMAPTVITGCVEVDTAVDEASLAEEAAGEDTESFDDWRVFSVDADVPYASRVLHSNTSVFDMYRVEVGKAIPFLCGESLTEEEFLARAEGGGADLWRKLSLPTTAVSVLTESEEENADLTAGLVTLWSHESGDWRIIGLRPFWTPKTKPQ